MLIFSKRLIPTSSDTSVPLCQQVVSVYGSLVYANGIYIVEPPVHNYGHPFHAILSTALAFEMKI